MAEVRAAMGKPGKSRKPQASGGDEVMGDWISEGPCFTVGNM